MSDNEMLDRLIEFYSQHFQIEYNIEADGLVVPVSAFMQSRQQKQLLGVSLKSLGPEARERVFFLKEQSFDMQAMSRLEKLLTFAEREYVHPGRDHAFTFISAVALAQSIEGEAAAALKKYKLRRNYHAHGWFLARAAVFGADGSGVCSKDGVDLKRMLQKVIAQQQ